MRFKILGLFAAVALVAACETAPDESAAASGAGTSASGSTQMSSSGGTMASRLGPIAGTAEDLVVNVGDRVFFDFDMHTLKPEARKTLEKQAAWLKKFFVQKVTIEGHADERGTTEYNLGLGDRRANAVKNYLVALGVSPDRIRVISYGEERPVALGSNEAAWAQNRRSVTKIVGAGS
ncbi:MAG: peptidoglycan-associated lipoprotein Pal [Rhodospirillales bacterium]|nr:peptidoglycan-associated lipoprotein Pal [Rhodospirillales bacterium]